MKNTKKNDEDIRIRRKGHIKLRRNGLKHESPRKKTAQL